MRRGGGMKVIILTQGGLPYRWRRHRISQSGNLIWQHYRGIAEVSRGHISRALIAQGEGLNVSKCLNQIVLCLNVKSSQVFFFFFLKGTTLRR